MNFLRNSCNSSHNTCFTAIFMKYDGTEKTDNRALSSSYSGNGFRFPLFFCKPICPVVLLSHRCESRLLALLVVVVAAFCPIKLDLLFIYYILRTKGQGQLKILNIYLYMIPLSAIEVRVRESHVL
jgi:hypothetical protein